MRGVCVEVLDQTFKFSISDTQTTIRFCLFKSRKTLFWLHCEQT